MVIMANRFHVQSGLVRQISCGNEQFLSETNVSIRTIGHCLLIFTWPHQPLGRGFHYEVFVGDDVKGSVMTDGARGPKPPLAIWKSGTKI